MSSGKALSRFHQPISVPGRRLMHHIPLKFVQKKVVGGGGRSLNQEIPLVPFIDFLLCIVLFLLSSFSATGELPIDKNVQLPAAQNTLDMVEAPMVAVAGSQVLVDGKAAGSVRELGAGRPKPIDELLERLKAKKNVWKQLHPGQEFNGTVILQIDRRVKARVVKSVFFTAAYAGYSNVSFMVGQVAAPGEGGGGGEH